jgi:hypothetical protein
MFSLDRAVNDCDTAVLARDAGYGAILAVGEPRL